MLDNAVATKNVFSSETDHVTLPPVQNITRQNLHTPAYFHKLIWKKYLQFSSSYLNPLPALNTKDSKDHRPSSFLPEEKDLNQTPSPWVIDQICQNKKILIVLL